MKTFIVSTSTKINLSREPIKEDAPEEFVITKEVKAKSYRHAFEVALPLFQSDDNYYFFCKARSSYVLVVSGAKDYFQMFSKSSNGGVVHLAPARPKKAEYAITKEVLHHCEGKFGRKKYNYDVIKYITNLNKTEYQVHLNSDAEFIYSRDYIMDISWKALQKFDPTGNFENILKYDPYDESPLDLLDEHREELENLTGKWNLIVPSLTKKQMQAAYYYIPCYFRFEKAIDAIMIKMKLT